MICLTFLGTVYECTRIIIRERAPSFDGDINETSRLRNERRSSLRRKIGHVRSRKHLLAPIRQKNSVRYTSERMTCKNVPSGRTGEHIINQYNARVNTANDTAVSLLIKYNHACTPCVYVYAAIVMLIQLQAREQRTRV